jgi:hypothetical protein
MSDPSCIRRRMLLAARQAYHADLPMSGLYQTIGWIDPPAVVRGELGVDVAVIGKIDRGILIAFRGTRPPFNIHDEDVVATFFDWVNDGACIPTHPPIYPGPVHFGFARSVEALWSKVMVNVRRLIDEGAPPALFVTGHSKGGALAALASWRFAKEIHPSPTVRLVTFASARPGGDEFRRALEAEPTISATRFEIKLDVVPDLPLGPDTNLGALELLDRLPFKVGRQAFYWPVGQAVKGGPDVADMMGSFFKRLGGIFKRRTELKSLFSLALVEAHSIEPASAYDQLVCGEEIACDHS